MAYPLRVKNFARSCGLLEKINAIDAAVLTRFGRQVEPKLREKPTESQRKLRALVAWRVAAVLSQFGAECNRNDQTADPAVTEMIQQAIDFYKAQIKDLDRQITSLIDQAAEFKVVAEVLHSCPGVGAVTVAVLLAELPELGKRKTTAGRSQVRRVLYMSALVSARYNPVMKKYYDRLLLKEKLKKVVLVAVMRKLLITLNVMARNGETWREPNSAKAAA